MVVKSAIPFGPGHPVKFANWASEGPRGEDCLRMLEDGSWDDYECQNALPTTLCQIYF
jgi:hypothetical protein